MNENQNDLTVAENQKHSSSEEVDLQNELKDGVNKFVLANKSLSKSVKRFTGNEYLDNEFNKGLKNG